MITKFLKVAKPKFQFERVQEFGANFTSADICTDQLLQLCTARTVWSDSVCRSISVPSGKLTTGMVTNEKQGKTYE